ncbi:unnamed protein product [Diatraea saccharalis]|uniref:Uncharacterized protein n=1 Tax=Diatraea saccharalis TaxID=40085 RepID=A0A9N9N432_9NEOP|nr:unnamed protein product [Diatraea saccharalis]
MPQYSTPNLAVLKITLGVKNFLVVSVYVEPVMSMSMKYMRDLKIWEEHIKSGGTRKDKYNIIDSWTYDRFVNREIVTSKSPRKTCNNGHLLLPVNFHSWNSKPPSHGSSTLNEDIRFVREKLQSMCQKKRQLRKRKSLLRQINFDSKPDFSFLNTISILLSTLIKQVANTSQRITEPWTTKDRKQYLYKERI